VLAEENFLLAPPQTLPGQLSVKAFEQSGFEPKVVCTDSDAENLVDLVLKGLGISLLLKKLVLYLSHPGIAVVDITPSVTSQISLCYPKTAKLSDAARHFVQCAESQSY